MSVVADEKMTLPVAAHMLGVSYERAKRMLLNGTLIGEQIAGRWWLVNALSVARILADKNRSDPLKS